MQRRWRRAIGRGLLMGVLVVLLAGCSATRLVYNQAHNLVFWWFDGYVDFDDRQRLLARDAIGEWFRWHRRNELPQYAALLSRARAEVGSPATPEQACRWFVEANQRFDAAFGHALPGLAEMLRRLSPAQLAHLEHKYVENNEELVDEHLQARPEARAEANFKRVLDRTEMLYGRMSAAQRERIAALILQSPFDPTRWLAERRQRQQDTLQTLAGLSTEQASIEQTETALRGLAQRARVSPNDSYRDYQQRLIQFNCGFAAQVHNLTTAEQRAAAAAKLKGWEDDARALAKEARSQAVESVH